MKRIGLIFIMSWPFLSISKAQTLIEQIEQAYSTLDSATYIDNIISSYTRWIEKTTEETYKLLHCPDSNSIEVIQWFNRIRTDSMYLKHLQKSKFLNRPGIKQFEYKMKYGTPLYVLNLKLKDRQTLQVDTGKLAFNLFYFDKRCKGRLYVYCYDGEYGDHGERYSAFSRKLVRNAPKVFRKIMRKHPKYLLFCPDLEGMNTILYVIDNDVYVYRIIQMQVYKLDDYMKNRTTIKNS